MDEDLMAAVSRGWAVMVILSLILVGFLGGSFRTEVTFMPEKTAATAAGKTFEEDLPARHWLGGLIQGEQADLQEALSRHTRGGRHLAQFSIVTKHTWTDLLVTMVTMGIYCPQTVTIRGRSEPTQTLADVTQAFPAPEKTLQP